MDKSSVSWFWRSLSVAVLGAVVASVPGGSHALELVPGGYGAVSAMPSQAPDETVDLAGEAASPSLALDFTPRGGTGLWARPEVSDGTDTALRFDLTVRAGGADAIQRFGLDTTHDALRANSNPSPTALTVGGAMRWSDWTVGGGLGRAQVLGEDVDLMAATLGYGRVRAEVAYRPVGIDPGSAQRGVDAEHRSRRLVLADPRE